MVAIEILISKTSIDAQDLNDGCTIVGSKDGFMARREQTILVTGSKPVVLTENDGVWN